MGTEEEIEEAVNKLKNFITKHAYVMRFYAKHGDIKKAAEERGKIAGLKLAISVLTKSQEGEEEI